MIGKLVIIGVGLIGGSLARALREAGTVRHIVGVGRSQVNLDTALELGIIDAKADCVRKAVKGADVVVIAATLGAMGSILEELEPALGPDTVVTDVGSAKSSVVALANQILGERSRNFVPGHPIAGTEKSGAGASFSGLFAGHKVILTPLSNTRLEAAELVKAMWEKTGATVVDMGAEEHDRILAATSHLPHLLAYALVDTLASLTDPEEIFGYAAGGFKDFTRIASSNPEMWCEIALANKEALLNICRLFSQRFGALGAALEAGDQQAIERVFTSAKTARDRFVVQE
jgi:prephenate dehydrogenase